MRKKYNNPKLKFYIGDVRDYNSVMDIMREVDFVFQLLNRYHHVSFIQYRLFILIY